MNPLATGVYFLAQILLSIWQNNQAASVKDVNGNVYRVYDLLFTFPSARLLNAIFLWNADLRTITYCYSSPGLPQPYPLNGWVNPNAGPAGQPGYSVPPPASGLATQPLSPPTAANQGSPGLSGSLTPFAGSGMPSGATLENLPLYTQSN